MVDCSPARTEFHLIWQTGRCECRGLPDSDFNLLAPSNATWNYRTKSTMVSGNSLLPGGTKSSPEPIMPNVDLLSLRSSVIPMRAILQEMCDITHYILKIIIYRQISKIRHTKFQNLNISRLVLQLFLCNILKPGVKSKMKMQLEQRQQAMLQLHLSDQQF